MMRPMMRAPPATTSAAGALGRRSRSACWPPAHAGSTEVLLTSSKKSCVGRFVAVPRPAMSDVVRPSEKRRLSRGRSARNHVNGGSQGVRGSRSGCFRWAEHRAQILRDGFRKGSEGPAEPAPSSKAPRKAPAESAGVFESAGGRRAGSARGGMGARRGVRGTRTRYSWPRNGSCGTRAGCVRRPEWVVRNPRGVCQASGMGSAESARGVPGVRDGLCGIRPGRLAESARGAESGGVVRADQKRGGRIRGGLPGALEGCHGCRGGYRVHRVVQCGIRPSLPRRSGPRGGVHPSVARKPDRANAVAGVITGVAAHGVARARRPCWLDVGQSRGRGRG
jgi:hypothetical protein